MLPASAITSPRLTVEGLEVATPFFTPLSTSSRSPGPLPQTSENHMPAVRGQGQWALGYREPLNANEQFKKDDNPLNVRARIIDRYQYTVRGWTDPFLTWKRDLKKRQEAGQDLAIPSEGQGSVVADRKVIPPAVTRGTVSITIRKPSNLIKRLDDFERERLLPLHEIGVEGAVARVPPLRPAGGLGPLHEVHDARREAGRPRHADLGTCQIAADSKT